MDQRFNKPIVFLSHSKKDSEFIKRLVADLPKYKIDVWFDEDEIRPGKPWLDSIFVHGIPRCDAILVYFTEASLASSVVKKEIDAGILQTLSDNNIVFLPFVNDSKIRPSLRSDIQTLQVMEWNDSNYDSLLPKVVAEIWMSYLERTVASATKDERVKRLEAELELEKLNNQREDIFSPAENAEFEFIWNSYDKMIPITIGISSKTNGKNKSSSAKGETFDLTINLATVIARIPELQDGEMQYIEYLLIESIQGLAISLLPDQYKDAECNDIVGFPELEYQLLMYGIIEDFRYPETVDVPYGRQMTHLERRMVLSKKFHRFRYWLDYHQKLPESIVMEVIKDT